MRKTEILTLFLQYESLDINDLTLLTDTSLENASTALKTYYRWGLLNRTRNGRSFSYSITDRGTNRLAFLIETQK